MSKKDEEIAAEIQIAASTDRMILTISVIAKEAMTPEEFSDVLFYIADKIAEEGEGIYEDGINSHYN